MFVSGVKCITRLDVSENNLDVELASVVNGVTRNRHLQSLNISKNLPKIKARDVGHVMDAIVQLVQVGRIEDKCTDFFVVLMGYKRCEWCQFPL